MLASKKKMIMASVVFGLISICLIIFIVSPLLKIIKEESDRLGVIKKDLLVFQQKVDYFNKAEQSHESLKSDSEKAKQLFVNPEVPIELIKFWEKTAVNSDISVNISPNASKTDDADAWPSMNFQLELKGRFSEFLRFLERVEAGPYLTEIQSLTARSSTKGKFSPINPDQVSQDDVNITLSLKVFTL